ncbi:MAG: MotA/TolQ/ExbB proton channel family protein [Verrucomicrobiota bacterium]|nr:MotA/TolQ/ExbB proton channel family protein [Verrucomicrobiota bacterium]
MKKFLITSLVALPVALNLFAQTTPPPAAGTSPAISASAPATTMPAATAPVTMSPATAPLSTAPGLAATPPGTVPVVPPPPGMSPSMGASVAPPVAAASASPAATVPPPPADTGNYLVDKFKHGGPIMWPILIVSVVAIAVVVERIFWWLGRWMRRDPKRIEKVFTAIENGDVAEASRLSRGSRDPILRMMWNGLNHQHASLQGALQVAAGIEIKRAGRFLVVMDTLVTLAPLLGLLGTITGLMKSFSFLGNEELAVTAVTGGIAEALIATACGLGIAIFALVPFNFFTSRVSNLEFELQTAATNLEVMLEAQKKGDLDITAMTK